MNELFSHLLSRARAGDTEALSKLSEQYESKVRVVAKVQLGRALRPYLDSQDLVQSVHRSLMMGLRNEKFSVSTPEELVALTITMVRRKIARVWRRMQRQHRMDGDSTDSNEVVDLLVELGSNRNLQGDDLEFRESVEELFRHLDEIERQIIILRLQDFTAPEIANRLGLTPVNVRVRMTRLRQRLAAASVMDDWL